MIGIKWTLYGAEISEEIIVADGLSMEATMAKNVELKRSLGGPRAMAKKVRGRS
jgi:hypothetical protein